MSNHFPERLPQIYRDKGFELWWLVYDRNCTKVAERLNNPTEDDDWPKPDHPIAVRTVNKWSHKEQWALRASQRLKEIAPGIHESVVATLTVASMEASTYLRGLVNDAAADTKFRLDAAKTILDRAGHLPWTRPSDDSKPLGPARDYAGAIAGKSDEELAAFLFGTAPALESGADGEPDYIDVAVAE